MAVVVEAVMAMVMMTMPVMATVAPVPERPDAQVDARRTMGMMIAMIAMVAGTRAMPMPPVTIAVPMSPVVHLIDDRGGSGALHAECACAGWCRLGHRCQGDDAECQCGTGNELPPTLHACLLLGNAPT